MIHFKNHKKGFTLIEVIISLAITGAILTPVFMIHEMILNRVSRSSRLFDYILLCSNMLYEARQKQEPDVQQFSLDKVDTDFGVSLTYSLEKGVDPKSSLASVQGLHKEFVTVLWTEVDQKKQERLVTFVYKKPEQKKS
jgi:prepilin-type N-terminal cleavage/methylation domain-containing protein